MVRAVYGRRFLAALIAVVLPGMVGCSGFFQPVDNSGGGGSGGGTATGNSVYVANLTKSSLNGFTVVPAVAAVAATATAPAVPATPANLTGLAGLPTAVAYQPLSMVVTPANTFLYVASLSGIYVYTINSGGSLTAPAANPRPAGVYAAAMAISPDGQWLVALDGTTQQLDIFQINTSTGALTSVTGVAVYSILSGTWTPTSICFSPNGQLIFASLGTAGDVSFTFNTSSGVAVAAANLQVPTISTSDFGLTVDSKSAYLYIARSGTQGGIAVYSIGGSGSLTPVSGSPFAAGLGTYAVQLDSTGSYLYAANRTDGTISGYSIVPGTTVSGLTLKQVTGSPFTSGISVQSLGMDRTGKYLLASALGGSPDLTMYSLDSDVPGQLDPVLTVSTDASPAGAYSIALTH
jgi:6-phosphogluconolactonase